MTIEVLAVETSELSSPSHISCPSVTLFLKVQQAKI